MDKKLISSIYSEFTVNPIDEIKISQTTLKEMIEFQLGKQIGNFIIKNMSELPVEYNEKIDVSNGNKICRIETILIDKEELNRLKDIEWKYNKLSEEVSCVDICKYT